MVSFKSLTNFIIAFTFAQSQHADCLSNCKVDPSSADWPSKAEWNALNQSVSGRLIAPVPIGAVCHPDRPEFNNQSCALLGQQWTNTSFHASNPASVDYNDDTCLPSAMAPCSPEGYPAYVVAATNAEDIQEGVKFAYRTGVRLIVKGTGHDFPGRSSGRGSLSIWTHNIRGIEINMKNDKDKVATAKIAAGMRVSEILTVAAEKNITIVTGADPNVGIGGWTTGGGHGPLTSRYGLGADQVLAMEVVTADGSFLQIDPNHHPDLFWAMRGGGGSTFSIIVSVTVRAYPALPYAQYLFSYKTTADSDTYWNLITLFHSFLPSISESDAMGYYYARTYVDSEVDPGKRGQLAGIFLLPEKTAAEAERIIAPLEAAVNNSNWDDNVYLDKATTTYPAFSPVWARNPPETVGTDGRLGSRLLDHNALTADQAKLKDSLRKSTPIPCTLIGHVVAGPGPRNVAVPGGGNSVLPAWRKTYTHVVLSRSWKPLNTTQEKAVTDDLRDVRVQALHDLAPETGAYVNEADPTEPDWQKTFWGENYARLADLKKKWDPQGVFWCRPCVGFDEWAVTGGDGIGQHEGQICRK